MHEFLSISKALADRQRVRLLVALREGELCACQLVELVGLAGSTVSKHLSLLQQAGLVTSRKSERWVHYRLAGASAPAAVREALEWVFKSLARSPDRRRDQLRLRKILKQDPSDLCKRQCHH